MPLLFSWLENPDSTKRQSKKLNEWYKEQKGENKNLSFADTTVYVEDWKESVDKLLVYI